MGKLDGLKMTNSAKQAISQAQKLGLTITSGYRSKAEDIRVGGTGKGYHTLGQALDVAGSKSKMDQYAKWAKESKLFRSVLWQVAGHFDHVHVSWDAKDVDNVLKEGDKGSLVAVIQKLLGGLSPDGIFGPKTEQAVKDFQKNRKLEQDGIVGEKTWNSLSEGAGLFFYR